MAGIVLAIVALWSVMVGVMSYLITLKTDLPELFKKMTGGIALLAVILGVAAADVPATNLQKIVFTGTAFVGILAGHFLSSLVHKRRLQKIGE